MAKVWEENSSFKVDIDLNKKKILLFRNVSISSGKIHMGHGEIIQSVMFYQDTKNFTRF